MLHCPECHAHAYFTVEGYTCDNQCEKIRRNPDEEIRNLERQWISEPTTENAIKLVRASQRAGVDAPSDAEDLYYMNLFQELAELVLGDPRLELWEKKEVKKRALKSRMYKQPYIRAKLTDFSSLSPDEVITLARDFGLLNFEPLPKIRIGKTIRKFSMIGPCLTSSYGRVFKETPLFFINQDGYRFSKRDYHLDPCLRCEDHPKTQYPDGYQD